MNICDYGCGQEAKYQLKNGKWCCSSHCTKCLVMRKKNSESLKNSDRTKYKWPLKNCKFCKVEFPNSTIKNHQINCYLNPINKKLCPVCENPIKKFRDQITCSNKCKGIFFKDKIRKINDEYWDSKGQRYYRYICFKYHKKECIICGEKIIISVHHYDHDHNNDSPKNLVPLCPTHHTYLHSKYSYLIKNDVDLYVKQFGGIS